MSTEIKNTLFRFISMRAPELTVTDENQQNKGFAFREASVDTGIFDEAIANLAKGTSKWQAMKTAAESFTPLTVDALKKLDDKLYAFSVWMAKNRLSFTQADLTKKIDGVLAIKDTKVLGQLWDNLFFQTVTQKDFYAKEIIIQLLLANHFINNYDSQDLEKSKALMKAKVVLPKLLFVDENDDASTSKVAAKEITSVPTAAMLKQQSIARAELYNEELKQLAKELKRIEKVYIKDRKTALEKDKQAHQTTIQPLLDQYVKDVEAANQNWCNVKDPSVVYDPKDPCNRPPSVPEPVLPKFEFSFREELDYDFLESKLSTSSFETLIGLVDNYVGDNSNSQARVLNQDYNVFIEDIEGFADLDNHIQDIISENNQIIVDNTTEEGNTLVSVGGVVIPVISSTHPDFTYQLCPKIIKQNSYTSPSPKYNLDMNIVVPDASWSVASFDYTLERTDANYSNNGLSTYLISGSGKNLSISNINIGAPKLDEEPNIVAFRGTISFTNGVVKTFDISQFNLHQCFMDVLDGEAVDNGSNLPNPSTSNEAPFVPTGFGVKQLGIADYNKVEQTTQGYIEGDVAHIENIMAREYKDRSTRRLRTKEETFSTSSESEREQLTDTTTSTRFEMHSEVAKVISDSKDFGAQSNVQYRPNGKLTLGAGANFATHNSREESTVQAVTNATEVTERALDRIVTKVKEERIEKIVEEFEENNSHGFDNRKGDKHVVGVFRWIDKIFKNQVVNYGKRLMFEFMVPQPAKLHVLGMTESANLNETVLVEPVDPRKATTHTLGDYSALTETKLKYWASKYNVEVDGLRKNQISISKAFKVEFADYDQEGNSLNDSLEIPEGYEVTKAYVSGGYYHHGNNDDNNKKMVISIGKDNFEYNKYTTSIDETINNINGIKGKLAVSASTFDVLSASFNVVAECQLTTEAEKQWQQETFKAIIDAYQDALDEYNEKLEAEKELGVQIKGANPGFYREFENKILRKNCISYLIDQNPDALNTYGKSNMYITNNNSSTFTFGNTEVDVSQKLDNYAAFVKFMEQAFEWDIMSYHLYPYYWGNRQDWASLYNNEESNDPLFRNFMQAGMARVIVTVRPGFEEAVRYYMQTGQIWNGGEVPVIEDELYLSIIDELRQPQGEKLGKAWWTRIPTPLTILQAQSIGLKVTKALPYNDDLSDFENPDEVPQSDQLDFDEALLGNESVVTTARLVGNIGGNEGIESKIVLKRVDGIIQDLTYCDTSGTWELNNLPAGRYELLLDADDDFPSNQFVVMEGSKEQVVELEDGQSIEINLEVKRL